MESLVYTQHYCDVRVIWMLEPDGHEKISIFGGYFYYRIGTESRQSRIPDRSERQIDDENSDG